MYIEITQGDTTFIIDNVGIKKNWFVSDYKDVINTVMAGFKKHLSDNSGSPISVKVESASNDGIEKEDPLLDKIKNVVKAKVVNSSKTKIEDEEEELLPLSAGVTDTPEFKPVKPEDLIKLKANGEL